MAEEPPAAEKSPFAAYERKRDGNGDRRSFEFRGARSNLGLLAAFVALLVFGAGIAWLLARDHVAPDAPPAAQTAIVLPLPDLPSAATVASAAPHPSAHPHVFVAPPRASGRTSVPQAIAVAPSAAPVPELETAPSSTATTSDEASTDNPY